MKKLTLALTFTLAACGPSEEERLLKEVQQNVSQSMLDPESARFRRLSIRSDGTVCGEVNGKNTYGGYVGFRPFAYRNGEVTVATPYETIEGLDTSEVEKLCGQSQEGTAVPSRPASATPAPPVQPTNSSVGAVVSECRQSTCTWKRVMGIRTIRQLPAGILKVETTYQGSSEHRSEPYPERYSPSINLRWEKEPVQTYVLCSRSQPSIAFKDRWEGGTGKWYGHLLDLFDTYGYNSGSAVTYMRVCHDMDFYQADREKVLMELGYRPGTRNEQVTLAAPDDLPNPPPPEAENSNG